MRMIQNKEYPATLQNLFALIVELFFAAQNAAKNEDDFLVRLKNSLIKTKKIAITTNIYFLYIRKNENEFFNIEFEKFNAEYKSCELSISYKQRKNNKEPFLTSETIFSFRLKSYKDLNLNLFRAILNAINFETFNFEAISLECMKTYRKK